MWLFTKVGFFSVTRSRYNDEELQIRARVKEDLENLKRYLPSLGSIVEMEDADYRYRIYVSVGDFKKVVDKIIDDIDYDNFKNKVAKEQGWKRSWLYGNVWSIMKDAEEHLSE